MFKFAPAALVAFALAAGSAKAQEVRDLGPGVSPAPATSADFKGCSAIGPVRRPLPASPPRRTIRSSATLN